MKSRLVKRQQVIGECCVVMNRGGLRALMMVALVAVVMMSGAPVARATLVPPVISTNTTWTRAGNPWTVASNVLVKNGATLEIDAGVVVEFTGNWKLEVDNTTAGEIVVQGAPYDSVYFRAAGGSGAPSQWQGIYVSGGAGSSFDYCVVLHAKDALKLNVSNAPITHCAFRRCRYGIWCLKSSPAITSSWVSETTASGILCEALLWTSDFSRPVIRDCNLFDNAGYNIYFNGYTWGGITTIDAQYNWWGTSSVLEIEASIYDNGDNAGCNAVVDYDHYYTQTPVEHRTWGSIKALFRE